MSLKERGREGQKGVEREHPSDTEANIVHFYKERSNRQCQNPCFLGKNTCWVWQVGDHLSKKARAIPVPW